MKSKFDLVVLVAYIAFWLGMAVEKVGEVSGGPTEFTWGLPFTVLAMLLPPAILGYLVGRGDDR